MDDQTTNNTILTVFTILIILVMSLALSWQIRTDGNNRAYVQALCDWSHTRADGDLEQRCGEAQDKTNTEYLCVTRSTNLNCWVEVK